MKTFRLCIILLVMLMLGGCSERNNREEAAVLSFPDDVDSIEVTFDFYPSEVTKALNADEIAAVTEWVLGLEVEQVPLDDAETPNNYAGGAAWHFVVNGGEFAFSYVDYDGGAILMNDEWYAVKNPSNPPVQE